MKLENFSERMSRILLMAPLYQLGKRKLPQANAETVSCMELGLMTLLFVTLPHFCRNRQRLLSFLILQHMKN